MAAEPMVAGPADAARVADEASGTYAEGIRAGLLGAATIALWFLILDTIDGRPLYTPNVLGTALLGGGEGLDRLPSLPISFEMVVTFTWIHVLVFLLIGLAASRLLVLAERDPSFGFGVVLLFVVFEFGFLAVSMVVAEPVLRAVAWPEVLVGNLLAAAAMTGLFWRRHPRLTIRP
jgi:hypothetical protein